jgi:beta-glucosidase
MTELVAGFWTLNKGDNRTRWQAQNDLQAYMMANTRLSIPLDIIEETLHGGMDGGTIFPMPCSMGPTWNAPLINQVGRVIGLEARVGGASLAYSPELQVDTGAYH